jgi:hypothetical protein
LLNLKYAQINVRKKPINFKHTLTKVIKLFVLILIFLFTKTFFII